MFFVNDISPLWQRGWERVVNKISKMIKNVETIVLSVAKLIGDSPEDTLAQDTSILHYG